MKSIYSKMTLLSLLFFFAPLAVASQTYIIANKSTPIEKITIEDLSNIFLGKKQFWTSNNKIEVAYVYGEKIKKNNFFKTHIQISYKKFKRYWLKKIFSGYGSPPKMFRRSNKLILFVQQTEGAIAYTNELPKDLSNIKVIEVIK